MDFYIIKKDSRVNNPIKIKSIKKILSSELEENLAIGNESAEVYFLDDDENYEYVDFIFFDSASTIQNRTFKEYLIISDKFKILFSKYNQNICFKPIILINNLSDRQDLYWIIKLKPIPNIDTINQDTFNMLVPLYEHRILRVSDKLESAFIITLEVVESILRRGCLGITFEKTNCTGGKNN